MKQCSMARIKQTTNRRKVLYGQKHLDTYCVYVPTLKKKQIGFKASDHLCFFSSQSPLRTGTTTKPSRKQRVCSLCGKPNHDKRTCKKNKNL